MEIKKASPLLTISVTALASLMPVLCAYPSFIPQLEFGTMLSVILLVEIIILQKGVLNYSVGPVQKKWILFFFATAVCTIISINTMQYTSGAKSSIFLRYMKVLAAVLIYLILGAPYFDKALGARIARNFGLVNTILVILQTITHSPLIGRVSSEAALRPAGFFYEPSNLSSYMIVVLCLILYDEQLKHKLFWTGVTILGICFSTSGTGIVLIPVVMIAYFLMAKNTEIDRNNPLNKIPFVILGMGILIAGLYAFSRTSIGQLTISRFLTEDGLGGSYRGRFESYANSLVKSMPLLYKTIGYGFGYRPTEYYFSSYNAILYGDGYVGLALVAFVLISSFWNGNATSKTIVLCYACLFMGAGIFNFAAITYFFSFIIANNKDKRGERLMEC